MHFGKSQKMLVILSLLPLYAFIVWLGVAHAYLDPSTTTYIIRIFVTIFISIGVLVGVFWKRITLFITNIKVKMMAKQIERQARSK